MATLHIRSVPEDLYERLQRLAESRNRSLSAEVVTLLHQALDAEETRRDQGRLLATIRRRRYRLPADAPDSTELLREDRRR
jgi:plasmid stability protein